VGGLLIWYNKNRAEKFRRSCPAESGTTRGQKIQKSEAEGRAIKIVGAGATTD